MAQEGRYFWVTPVADGQVKIGLNNNGVSELGQVNFIDLPDVGTQLTQDGEFISVEAEKAVTDIPSPVTGEVVAVNPNLVDSTDDLNGDVESSRWILTVQSYAEM
jgi:glycine cleavage system H protein